ncbi:MAG TPA: arsenate reductase ArsC [Anaerolineales bacterium]|nr:arsenate reductase ArsC [Anaerolineales bacterium]
MHKARVLFLCTGNSARSQMAEAFLRAHANAHFEVHSAGIEPKGFILPEVLEVMKERGIDMSGQWSKSVTEYLGKVHFSHVITVCGEAEENCPAVFLNMGIHEHWPFDDPAKLEGDEAERLDFTRTIRDQMEQRIRQWLESQNLRPTGFDERPY